MASTQAVLCCLYLWLISVGICFYPVVYPETTSSTSGCGSNGPQLDNKLLEALKEIHQQLPPPGCLSNTYQSCAHILYCNSFALSGYYHIQVANGSQVQVFCDMEGNHCEGEGGWTRVAYLNMTDPSSQCPSNFHNVTIGATTFCVKNNNGCVNWPFETHGITYSRVCGYAHGYPFGSLDSFRNSNSTKTLSDNYVDGVSITYGTQATHIWTYVAGSSEDGVNYTQSYCPCNTNSHINTVPAYVGDDYYCEAGPEGNHTSGFEWYTNDTLWDGKMCLGHEGPCCKHSTLPWFIKNLPTPTSATIELRLCTDEDSDEENIGLEGLSVLIK